jgi:hypothetical protein
VGETKARDLLAPVYDWFNEASTPPILRTPKALLDELALGPDLARFCHSEPGFSITEIRLRADI